MAPVSLYDRLGQTEDEDDGESLIAAIAQEHSTGEVLMLAWMNRQAIHETLSTGKAVYWSRSRRCLWRKGETSGNTQDVVEMRFDCDHDAILLRVVQHGPACHLGKRSCFFRLVGTEGQLFDDPFA